MTKFELSLLSEYLVGTRLVGYEKDKSKVSAMLNCYEQNEKNNPDPNLYL